jgi:hypothetical protein
MKDAWEEIVRLLGCEAPEAETNTPSLLLSFRREQQKQKLERICSEHRIKYEWLSQS